MQEMQDAVFLGLVVLVFGVLGLVEGIISIFKPLKNDHGAGAFLLMNSPIMIFLGLCWLLTGLGVKL